MGKIINLLQYTDLIFQIVGTTYNSDVLIYFSGWQHISDHDVEGPRKCTTTDFVWIKSCVTSIIWINVFLVGIILIYITEILLNRMIGMIIFIMRDKVLKNMVKDISSNSNILLYSAFWYYIL